MCKGGKRFLRFSHHRISPRCYVIVGTFTVEAALESIAGVCWDENSRVTYSSFEGISCSEKDDAIKIFQ